MAKATLRLCRGFAKPDLKPCQHRAAPHPGKNTPPRPHRPFLARRNGGHRGRLARPLIITLFARAREGGEDVGLTWPQPQALQLRGAAAPLPSPARALAGRVQTLLNSPPISRPGRLGRVGKAGVGVRQAPQRIPKHSRRFQHLPNFTQTHPSPQSPPKTFLAVVVHKCANMLAFTESKSYIDNHERRTRLN
jgi:hypothetical protein